MSAQGGLFRSQLVLEEHRALYDWWRDSFEDELPPKSSDFDPTAMPEVLPGVSVMERDTEQAWRVRLAGTRFYETLGEEISGMAIEGLPLGVDGRGWVRALDLACDTGRPVCGAQRLIWRGRERGLARFWLRLPLRAQSGGRQQVLGHESFRPLEAALAAPAVAWAG